MRSMTISVTEFSSGFVMGPSTIGGVNGVPMLTSQLASGTGILHEGNFSLPEIPTGRIGACVFKASHANPVRARRNRPVSLMDIYPTLAELTGLEVPPHVEGNSLVPLLEDSRAPWKHVALTTAGFRNHSVRDERYRYTRWADGSEELYDHYNDPHEWKNLARTEALAGIKRELASELPHRNAPPNR